MLSLRLQHPALLVILLYTIVNLSNILKTSHYEETNP